MKNILLALLGVVFMIYLGVNGMTNKYATGPFFLFVGVCTAIGLSLDIANVIRQKIRKANLKKLGGRW